MEFPGEMLRSQLVFYLTGITLYYLLGIPALSSVLKTIPALALATTCPVYGWAAIGDYFLSEPVFGFGLHDNINLGILSFTIFLLSLKSVLTTNETRGVGALMAYGLLTQKTIFLILIYSGILFLHLRSRYRQLPPIRTLVHLNMWHSPAIVQMLGIVIYIISDLFVLGDLLELSPRKSMGLPLYWLGLLLLKCSS